MEEMLAGLSEFVRRQRQLSLQQHCLWRQRAVDAGPLQLLLHPQPVAPRVSIYNNRLGGLSREPKGTRFGSVMFCVCVGTGFVD